MAITRCCWLPFLNIFVQGLPVRLPVQEILDLILDMNCLLNTEIYDDARDLRLSDLRREIFYRLLGCAYF